MTIEGLHQVISPIVKIEKVGGFKKIAIDAFIFLHRGLHGNGAPVECVVKTVKMLRDEGVDEIIVVIDGKPLVSKAGELAKRAASKEACGRSGEVTPEHIKQLIEAMRELGIEVVVAPYEGDAQLAFFAAKGFAVLTEDGDPIALGCDTVLTKLDKDTREVCVVRADSLRLGESFQLLNFTKRMITQVCVFAGCDHLPSPRGVSIRTARKLLAEYKTPARVINAMRRSPGIKVPDGYEEDFANAMLTYVHPRVFDPGAGKLVTLIPLPADLAKRGDELDDFIGADMDADMAVRIATGALDPRTLQPYGAAAWPPLAPPAKRRLAQTSLVPAKKPAPSQALITKFFVGK